MPGRSQSTSVMPVETFGDSNQVLDAINRFTKMHQRWKSVTESDVSYNRDPWKPFSIRFASSK